MTHTITIGREDGKLKIGEEDRPSNHPADHMILALVGKHGDETLLALSEDERREIVAALAPPAPRMANEPGA